jgi:hypothetical protein
MATIIDRIRAFLRSRQGRRLARQARKRFNKPDNQRRLRRLAQQFRERDGR